MNPSSPLLGLRLASVLSLCALAACSSSSGKGSAGASPDGGTHADSSTARDSGTGGTDSGAAGVDTGGPGTTDSGMESTDSATGTTDSSGVGPTDGGTGNPDGAGTVDSGSPEGGMSSPEGGTQNPDAAMNNPDAEVLLPSATVKKVVSGFQHACALTTTGAVRCWGYSDHGQVGNGVVSEETAIDAPVQVTGLTSGVIDISTTSDHTCVVMATGGVKCWGANDQGQLGTSSMVDSAVPVDIAGVTGVTSISAGQAHTCAVSPGAVTCWGANDAQQCGVDTMGSPSPPVVVAGLATGVLMASAGFEHSCAVTAAGAVQCWGDNTYGELGQGGDGFPVLPPANATGLASGVTAVSAGYNHTCALTTAGALLCWGLDEEGQLGNNMSGVALEFDTPIAVQGITSGATEISAGVDFTCAVVGGAAKCWGDGIEGDLGNGTDNESDVPAQVTGLTSGVAQVAAGSFGCATLSTGAAKCWGTNGGGELGDGLDGIHSVQDESNVPVAVLSLP